MKIYTKTGDDGQTGLFGGERVSKTHIRIEAYGTIDELNAAIGLARCESLLPEIDATLVRVQHVLFNVGGELASLPSMLDRVPRVTSADALALEQAIDAFDDRLPPLREFILPGGNRSAALLHLARTICRRGERRVLELRAHDATAVAEPIVVFLNRLSDYLFVAARAANVLQGGQEIPWRA